MASKGWYDKHELASVWLTPSESKHLQVILSHTSMENFADWVRAALRAWSSRIPESQGKVRIELDPERDRPALSHAQAILARDGSAMTDAWRGEPNPDSRSELRRQAAQLLDDAAHLSSILEKLEERRYVATEGLKAARHRYVPEARRKTSHSSTSPSRRNQSK